MNSIFLHSRSLLNLYGVDKATLVYRTVSVLNIGTFIVFRLSTTVFLILWDCLHYTVLPSFYFAVLFFVMFSMLIVNLILFYRVSGTFTLVSILVGAVSRQLRERTERTELRTGAVALGADRRASPPTGGGGKRCRRRREWRAGRRRG